MTVPTGAWAHGAVADFLDVYQFVGIDLEEVPVEQDRVGEALPTLGDAAPWRFPG